MSPFVRTIHFGLIAGRTSRLYMTSTRTYRDAIDHLNSLQSNAAALEAVRASGGRSSEFTVPEMTEYLERIGYSVRQCTQATSVIQCPKSS